MGTLVLICVSVLMTIINSVILIAIAGTMAKMLKSFEEREDKVPDGNLVDLPNQPSYADIAMYPNYDGFQARQPNLDGAYGMMNDEDEE